MQIVNLNDHELHRWYRALAYLEKYLRDESTDPSFDLSKMISVTNFEHKLVKETKTSNITSKPEVKLPSAVSGTSKEDELKHLSQIIKEINETDNNKCESIEKTGSKHNTAAGASSLYAIKDHLLADKDLEQKALNNTRKDFELSVNTKSEQYLLDAWSENQELFGAILENKELRKQIFSVFINDIYNKFRNESISLSSVNFKEKNKNALWQAIKDTKLGKWSEKISDLLHKLELFEADMRV